MNPLLFPVAAIQGLRVRARTERLRPPDGPASGTAGDGSGPPVRVAVLGESTAAGCGADTHDDGFPGSLARALAARTGRPVTWETTGQYGATADVIRHQLLPQVTRDVDVAVLLAGANDVLTRRPVTHWAQDVTAIVDELGSRAEHVVVSGIPPFENFPALPRTLRRYLAGRARILDTAARQVCSTRSGVTWLDTVELGPTGPDFFARDRFHPSSTGYRRWAEAVADHVVPQPSGVD